MSDIFPTCVGELLPAAPSDRAQVVKPCCLLCSYSTICTIGSRSRTLSLILPAAIRA
uniref:Uncharacterized protein n=1 Tax=Physcomitrium patens TaxID=3218 RepID=A0A2K1L1K1_PHYPA|nr:hypothetical protein PHYPA_002697 [Physcomitrium patens]